MSWAVWWSAVPLFESKILPEFACSPFADLLSRGYSKLLINVSGLFVSPATCLMAPAPRDPELDKRKKLDGWFLLKSLTLINTEQNPVWIGSHLSTQRFGKAKLS